MKQSESQEVDFETFRLEDLNEENVRSLSPEQQRILKLEKRVAELETQMLSCLRWMRIQAEKEAKTQDPNYPAHEPLKV